MKKMTVGEFVVHVVIWLLGVVGMFLVWNFAGDYRRVLAAPDVSAVVNGLAALACGTLVLYDLYKNEKRFKQFFLDVEKNCQRRHRRQLRRSIQRGRCVRDPKLPQDFFGAD